MVNKFFGNNFPSRNRKAWIRIVEAFMGILLIATVLMILVDDSSDLGNDQLEKIFEEEVAVLKGIQMNDSLRAEIMESEMPVNSSKDNFPLNVKNKIEEDKPSYLECVSKICPLKSECFLESDLEDKDIYVKSVPILASLNKYEPRQLKLFCWEK